MSFFKACRSALEFCLTLFLFALSLFFLLLPLVPRIASFIGSSLQENPESWRAVGIFLLLASLFTFAIFFAANRGKFLVVKMGAKVHDKLLSKAIEECMIKNFANRVRFSGIEIDGNSQIILSIEPLEKGEKIFEDLEREISFLLQERFGIFDPFYTCIRGQI